MPPRAADVAIPSPLLSERPTVWQALITQLSRDDAAAWVRKRYLHILIVVAGLAASTYLRAQFLDFESQDYTVFLSKWTAYIRQVGLGTAYKYGFYNYSPFYAYMLGLAVTFFPDGNTVHIIKYLTFMWEIFAAYWAYRITALHYRDRPLSILPITAAMLLLLSPSVISNGSATGQCDILLAGFVLAALCKIIERKPTQALVYAGLAFAFKPQAVFLSPFLLILMLRGDMPWKRLWIVPAMYVASCIPAWLEGRDMMNLLTIYTSQMRGHRVSYNAGNYYLYLNGDHDNTGIIRMGCLAAFLTASFFVWRIHRGWRTRLDAESCLLVSLFFAGLMPYILPLMHDRYFFMADMISLVLACIRPRLFFITVLFQAASLMVLPPAQMPRVGGIMGWVQSFGLMNAITVNLVAIVCVYVTGRVIAWNGKIEKET